MSVTGDLARTWMRSMARRLLAHPQPSKASQHHFTDTQRPRSFFRRTQRVQLLQSQAAATGSGTLSKQAQPASESEPDTPWLIVGLGNPGARYDGTRHNVGFHVLDSLASRAGVSLTSARDKALQARGVIAGQQVVLAKPITFMNLSGEAVGKLTRYYKISPQQVLVIYDDLDLPLGKVRLRAKGSHGGHNGMRSIMQHMKGGQDFPRLKIGIGRPEGRMPVASFVLQGFTKAEAVEISIAAQECCDIVQTIMKVGVEKAMSGVRA